MPKRTNNNITQDNNTGNPNVPATANKARVFDNLTSGYLLSIGQLCDNECTALFEKDKVTIKNKQQETIMTGPRQKTTGLWTVTIPTKQTKENMSNGMLHNKKTKQDLAKYHHASLWYPTKSTLLKAIKKRLPSHIPGPYL